MSHDRRPDRNRHPICSQRPGVKTRDAASARAPNQQESLVMNDTVINRVQELARAARMLALVGASLKLQSAGAGGTSIRQQVERGVELVLGEATGALGLPEHAQLLSTIEMALVESNDLFRNVGQPAGWKVEEPTTLEAMGRASSSAFDRILALAETRAGLRSCFSGRFLDVGTGVGGIALRAAETCPGLAVEAIDIWAPALRLAERRVADSPHASRIELHELDITELDPKPRFTLAWLPTMFMPRPIVQEAITRIASASRPAAWFVTALYTTPEDPFSAVMSTLRTLRSGGEITDAEELAALLRSRGYVGVEVDMSAVATLVFGRLP
jgi:SAM-dependent methyltransferase